MQLTVHASTPAYALASWGPCLCLIAHAELERSIWQASVRVIEKLAVDFPSGILALTVLEHVGGPPHPTRRAEAEQHASNVERFVSRAAVVIEGGGFRSAVIRSVITGMGVLARKKRYPRHVFGHVADAVSWLSERAQQPLDAEAFLTSLEQLRRRLSRHHEVA